jgi:hypothetical protein
MQIARTRKLRSIVLMQHFVQSNDGEQAGKTLQRNSLAWIQVTNRNNHTWISEGEINVSSIT